MKLFGKRMIAAIMAAVLAVSLAACNGGGAGISSFDATQYVQGVLDENYLGKFDPDFLELVDSTESEAEEIYLGSLEIEAGVFADYFYIDNMTGDVLDATIELYKDIYALSKYTVSEAVEIDDNTFHVTVTVAPIDLLRMVVEELSSDEPTFPALVEFDNTYAEADVNAMTDEEYAQYDKDWANMVIALTRDKLSQAGYLEEQSQVVQVVKDSDNLWSINQTDFMNVDYFIIDYNSFY